MVAARFVMMEAVSGPLSFLRAEWVKAVDHIPHCSRDRTDPGAELSVLQSVSRQNTNMRGLGTLCQGGGRVPGVPVGTLLHQGWGKGQPGYEHPLAEACAQNRASQAEWQFGNFLSPPFPPQILQTNSAG